MKVRLGEVCIINPKSHLLTDDTEVSFIPMQSVSEYGLVDARAVKKYHEVRKGFSYFEDGDVLFAKITPCMENGKGGIAKALRNGIGFGSTEFHVLRPNIQRITSKWLYYVTSWPVFRAECEKNMTGSAGQKRVLKGFLENYEVKLPPIEIQKRQTAILDIVNDLISQRKQQLVKLDELVKSRAFEQFAISDLEVAA